MAFPFHMLWHAIVLHLLVELRIPYGQHFLLFTVLLGGTFICLLIQSWQLVPLLCDLVLSFICATRWIPDG